MIKRSLVAKLSLPDLQRLTMGQVITYGLTAVIFCGLLLNLALASADGSTSAVIFVVLVIQLVGFIVLLVTYSKSFMHYGLLARVLIPLIAGLSLVLTFVYITA